MPKLSCWRSIHALVSTQATMLGVDAEIAPGARRVIPGLEADGPSGRLSTLEELSSPPRQVLGEPDALPLAGFNTPVRAPNPSGGSPIRISASGAMVARIRPVSPAS